MTPARIALLAVAAVLASAGPARAQSGSVTIGLYAPTAPFDGTGDRIAFVNDLATHLAGSAGVKVTGKVYASASAFAKAIKNKDIQYAVVDAPYAGALGLPWKPLGAAVRGGSSTVAWQLVAGSGVRTLSDLEGKKVVVPATGARPHAFVTNVLFEGEIDAAHFAKILEAPDAKSALTMVSVGKADAALVPGGVDLPGGTSRVMTLATVGWPMFVALPGAEEARTRALVAGLASFSSTEVFGGFGDAADGRYKELTARFSRTTKRGLMAVPAPARLGVREILAGRSFTIPLSNVLELFEAPPKPSSRVRK